MTSVNAEGSSELYSCSRLIQLTCMPICITYMKMKHDYYSSYFRGSAPDRVVVPRINSGISCHRSGRHRLLGMAWWRHERGCWLGSLDATQWSVYYVTASHGNCLFSVHSTHARPPQHNVRPPFQLSISTLLSRSRLHVSHHDPLLESRIFKSFFSDFQTWLFTFFWVLSPSKWVHILHSSIKFAKCL